MEWSVFEKSPLGVIEGNGRSEEVKFVSVVAQEEEEWEEVYVRLNARLVKVSREALDVVRTYGPECQMSRQAAGKMVARFEEIVETTAMNTVNWVTLVHRLGRLFEAMQAPTFLFYNSQKLLGRAVEALAGAHGSLTSRQICNVFWALSKVGRRVLVVHRGQTTVPQFYSLLFTRLIQFRSIEPYEMASIVGSLGTLDFDARNCKVVLDHLTSLTVDRLDEFMPPNISNVVRGLGRLSYRPRNLFLKNAAERTLETLDGFDPFQMSNTIWGFGNLRTRAAVRYLLPSMERYFVKELWNYQPHSIPLILWSFVKLHYVPEKATLDRTVNVLKNRLPALTAKSVSHVAYSFALFDSSLPPEFVQQMKIAFFSKSERIRLQSMTLFAWCLAILFSLDSEFFERIVQHIEAADWQNELEPYEKRQLYQCMIHLQFFVPDGQSTIDKISPELMQACRAAWNEGQDTKFQDTVALSTLPLFQRLGYAVESRQESETGLASSYVDVISRADEEGLIAVQVTIPAHQFRNDKTMVKGPRRWSIKVLEKKGYRVLQVSGKMWKDLETPEERIKYLESLLNEMREREK